MFLNDFIVWIYAYILHVHTYDKSSSEEIMCGV